MGIMAYPLNSQFQVETCIARTLRVRSRCVPVPFSIRPGPIPDFPGPRILNRGGARLPFAGGRRLGVSDRELSSLSLNIQSGRVALAFPVSKSQFQRKLARP